MKPSPALQTIGKMKDTLRGRAVGILIADGSDCAVIKKIKKAATDAGAGVKIVAPRVGGAKLADGSMLAVDGQLVGTPSVLFDAIAVILPDEGATALSKESAAINFVRELITRKEKGQNVTTALPVDREASKVIDLMDALRRSLAGKGGGSKESTTLKIRKRAV